MKDNTRKVSMLRLLRDKDKEFAVGESLGLYLPDGESHCEVLANTMLVKYLVLPPWSNDLKLLVESVRNTNFSFALLPFPKLNIFYLLFKVGNLPWVGAPYSFFVNPEDRGFNQFCSTTCGDGYYVYLTLVNACTGHVVRTCVLSLPRSFSLEVLKAAQEQRDRTKYDPKKRGSRVLMSIDQFVQLCKKAELEYAGGSFDMMAADAIARCSVNARNIIDGR